jgi:hypothetical protein
MVVHGCLWLFIAAMVALAAHVVHARSWLQWMVLAIPYILAVPQIPAISRPALRL